MIEKPELPGSSERSRRSTGILLLLLAASLWSISGVALKVINSPSATSFAFWRSVGAALVAGVLMLTPLARGRWPEPVRMTVSVILYWLTTWLLLTSMRTGTAAQGILLQYSGPLWCALLGWVLFRHRLDSRLLVALALGLAGIAVMIVGGFRAGGPAQWTSLLAGIGAGISYGSLILCLDRLDRARPGTSAVRIVLINNLGSALLLAPFAFDSTGLSITGSAALLIVGVGVIQLGIPYLLFQIALRRTSPVEAALITILEPVLNPVWVWLFASETPTLYTAAGGALILMAMAVEVSRK